MLDQPLCFVRMPFGTQPDPAGRPDIDFDRIWRLAVRPAIEDAGLQPVRAGQETSGDVVHAPAFERLMLCELAVVDLTTAGANVFYELGARHAARPSSTQTIFADNRPLPLDAEGLDSLPYDLGNDNRLGDREARALRRGLGERLRELRRLADRNDTVETPVFELLGKWKPADLARLKTDVFRDRVRIRAEPREVMARARAKGLEEGLADLDRLRDDLGDLESVEAAVLVDLLLSLRALKAWSRIIDLYDDMPATLRRQILVREQLAFALNRRAGAEDRPQDRQRALRLLEAVEEEQGSSAETCAIIGRIYKDLWEEARQEGTDDAPGYLRKAIDAYVRGFETDPRDAFPGINAVTLLDLRGDARSMKKRDQLLPVVHFAVRQRLRGKDPDYWDHATVVQLAVLASDRETAGESLASALAEVREIWEPETTAYNLGILREVRAERGEDVDWLDDILTALAEARPVR